MATKKSVFETLSSIDVSNHVDVIKMKKGPALSYVSWVWAWNIISNNYPDTPTPRFTKFPEMVLKTHQQEYTVQSYGKTYKRYRTVVDDSLITDRKVPYLTTPTGTMVECTLTIEGRDYTESLYVMDNTNNAVINPTMQQINKTQKRCFVKAAALAGLGLNIYAGEDLPIGDINQQDQAQQEAKSKEKEKQKEQNFIRQIRKDYEIKVHEIASRTKQNDDAVKSVIGSSMKAKLDLPKLSNKELWEQSDKFAAELLKETLKESEAAHA